MACGIYMIRNRVNGKMYIGQAVDNEKRWGDHKSELRRNCHINRHLQSAWNKYGENNFEFTILCECDESQLNTKEIEYISKLRSYDPDFGYNKTYGGEGGRPTEETRRKLSEANKGKTRSEETRQKLSEAHTGKTLSEETRQKMSEAKKGENNSMYGKHPSKETRQKISEANKGRTRSEETRQKLSEANKGKTLSEETKKKIGEANKGRTHSEEARRKMSEANKGKILSEETKRKLREANKGKPRPEETKRKISESHKGKILSEETKKKLSEANKGHIVSEETRRKLSIPIVQIDPSTDKVVNVWGSSMAAAREGGFHQGAINDCCNGKHKTHKGYKWQYLHYYISQIDSRIKKIILFDKEYEF